MSGGWGQGPAYLVAGGFGVGVGAAARHYLEGTVDPSAGAGLAAPIASLYARDNAGVGETWQKTGAADTAWAIVGGGGGGAAIRMTVHLAVNFTTGGASKVPFDTVDDDPLGMWDMVNSHAVVPVGAGGLWSVGFSLGCGNNGITDLNGQVFASGSQNQGASVGASWPAPVGPIVRLIATTKVMDLADGDIVRVDAYGQDDLSQPVDVDGSPYSTFLWMVRLGT